VNPTERKTNAPETRRKRGKILYSAAVVLLFGLFAFQLWFHAVRTSATFDEPAHTVAGYRYWQCGDFGINPEHPPLLKLLAAAPLTARSLVEPHWECGSRLTPKPEMFSAGGAFLVNNNPDSVLIPARLAAALMSLLLAALVFLAAWEMFGRREALAALAIFAFEPNLIAHGSLVTTDMALAATAFAAAYALYRYVRNPNWARFSIVGLAFGLMLAAKHTAVIFVPILFALALADAFLYRRAETRLPNQVFRRTAAFAGFLLIGFVLLWSFYGFRYYALPNAKQNSVSVDEYIKINGRPEMIESLPAKIVSTINRTRIFPESYTLGLADVVASGSRNTWIFGENYATGQWFYFPLAFAVKSSIALLILLPLGFVFAFFNREKWREMLFILLPPVFFFAFALTSKLNIGVRHILPVYAFFIVAAAVGAVWISRKFYYFRYALVALLIFHAAAAVRTAPNYIAFSNDFFGGTNHTYRIFRESNVDWGQNFKLVNEYLARENITDCWFAGFGNREVMSVSQPCRILPVGFARTFETARVDEPVPPIPSVIEGTVLISVSNLPPRGGDEYVPIAQSEPIAQIGGTIFVYRGRFEIPLAAALRHTMRTAQLLQLNRTEEAIADARRAVELAPLDARPHLALGLSLLRAGKREEARRAFETVIETSKSNPALFHNSEVRARREIERLK
jgi:4-amino-4-deoxy-L-arabinose transferase-like glycosyltransferase